MSEWVSEWVSKWVMGHLAGMQTLLFNHNTFKHCRVRFLWQCISCSLFTFEISTIIIVRSLLIYCKKRQKNRSRDLYLSQHVQQRRLLFILESLRRTPTDTLDISGRTSSRGMRRGSLRPNIKTKLSGNLSPTGSNPTGNKLPVGRRRSTANRRS